MAAPTWSEADAREVLRRPTATDDKYSRGVVGMRTGSAAYPGAAVLGVEAAWQTGIGMVRYVGPERAQDLVLARRPETVAGMGRVQAWVLGSGTSASERPDDETTALRRILSADEPVVVDAGALDLAHGATAPRLLTPHDREHDRVRESCGLARIGADADDDRREQAARETAAHMDAVVLLKGAVTLVATPGGWTRRVESGTPWLATAGTGDVLGGILGALVAGAGAVGTEELGPLAATGAWLHGLAATRISASRGAAGGPFTALELAGALPFVIGDLLAAASGEHSD